MLIDLDHTLFDSDASELAAFDHAMRSAGIPEPKAYFDDFVAINRALWADVERGAVTPDQVRTARFRELVARFDLDADPVAIAAAYVRGLSNHGELYPDAMELLETLALTTRLGLVTNGLSDVQRARITRLGIERFFDTIVVSAEVGASKPGTEIFDLAFDGLGSPPKETALMVGDSLSSDIRGGKNYGIDTCWFNPNGAHADTGITPTYEIASLMEVPELLDSSS